MPPKLENLYFFFLNSKDIKGKQVTINFTLNSTILQSNITINI